MRTYNINYFVKSKIKINKKQLIEIMKLILQEIKGNKDFEVGLHFIESNEMKDLNHTYRNKDKTTDVLSFPINQDNRIKERTYDLGDVFINYELLEENANKKNINVNTEIALLFIHSLYHLIGYSHSKDEDFETMLTKEKAIWKKAKLDYCLE